MNRQQRRKSEKPIHQNFNCKKMDRKTRNKSMRIGKADKEMFESQGFKTIGKSKRRRKNV